jgi:hypothetical protein
MTPTVRHTPRHASTLTIDARNRAARTFLQGLAYTTGLALALVVYNAFQSANGWGGFDWDTLGFAATQAVVTAGEPTTAPADIAMVTALSHLDDTTTPDT